MKPGKVFWGVAFLSAGILIMLDKLGIASVGFSAVWRFWPVIIVMVGAAMVMGKQSLKTGAAGVAGLLLGLMVAAVFGTDWVERDRSEGIVDQEFTRPYDPAIRIARLNLDAGAGKFVIAETCTALVEAKTTTSIGKYDFRTDSADSSAEVYVAMEGHKSGWRIGGWQNRVTMSLNDRPEWRLDLDVGAAQVDLDLRAYRLRSLNLDAGAATVTVRLGALSRESDITINAGASSIKVEVPEAAGCEVHVEAPLSSKKFPGFKRVGEGMYRSENFDAADHKINIRLEAGVSSLRVRRVEPS